VSAANSLRRAISLPWVEDEVTKASAEERQSSMTVRWCLISKVFVLNIPHANTYLRVKERYDHDC